MRHPAYTDTTSYQNKVCGIFGEFVLLVLNVDLSLAFWEKLGFKPISTMTTPYSWSILSNGLSVIGLPQTTTFNQPAITFFAANIPTRIEASKAGGLSQDMDKESGNITLITPEQQPISLFKLDL